MRDLERTFSAYQHKDPGTGSPGTLVRGSTAAAGGGGGGGGGGSGEVQRRSRPLSMFGERPRELSLIDGRRAQNLNILLSRYKLSEEEVRTTMLSMDKEERLDKDMVEQLLKYVITPAEKELLDGHIHESHNFARPDRFMLATST